MPSCKRHSSRHSTCYRYPSDLTDEQWGLIVPLLSPTEGSPRGGQPRRVDLREVVNAILCLLRTGCAWRHMPREFPAWQTVYGYFSRWRDDGTNARIHDALRETVRRSEGRKAAPSAGIVDSQSLRGADTVGRATRGYDAGKKVNGRKRHIVVDTIGLLLVIVVTAANVQDRDGGKQVLRLMHEGFPGVRLIWADGGYAGQLVTWARCVVRLTLAIVKRNEAHRFIVLPRRWVVERTFAWLVKCRRLGWDYERLPETSEAFVQWAMVGLMVRRLAPDRTTRRAWGSNRPVTVAA
jgi:transposase